MTLSLKAILALVIVCITSTICVSIHDFPRGRSQSTNQTVPYTQQTISITAPSLELFQPRLLVFDGEADKFSVFNLAHQETSYHSSLERCGRCVEIIPLLVDALRRHFPSRFSRGKDPFQLIFTDTDFPVSECLNQPEVCQSSRFAPILSFGSVPKNPLFLPSVETFPNWFYTRCLYEWRVNGQEPCLWSKDLPTNHKLWDGLIPQVIWRGSDFSFLPKFSPFAQLGPGWKFWTPEEGRLSSLEEASTALLSLWDNLSPRWRAVVLTLKAEAEAEMEHGDRTLPWINCKFFGTFGLDWHRRYQSAGVPVAAQEYMSSTEMARYKYQIDLGGGGGTSWRGTLTKLAMPGLLFHHETPSKDWFYDDLIPWVHYVPVKCDLSDLREKYLWAEANPTHAQRISRAGTEFFVRVMSKGYMEALYEKLFVQKLSEIVRSYQPADGETIDSIMSKYNEKLFRVQELATCDQTECNTKGVMRKLPLE